MTKYQLEDKKSQCAGAECGTLSQEAKQFQAIPPGRTQIQKRSSSSTATAKAAEEQRVISRGGRTWGRAFRTCAATHRNASRCVRAAWAPTVYTFTSAAVLTSDADRYSDDVRAEVGVPSEQLELLANCIEKYSEAAMGAHPAAWSALKRPSDADMATSTHALCNQLDNLAAYETSDARARIAVPTLRWLTYILQVMLVQWSDHLRVQEFGECDHKQSYTEAERTKYLDFCTTHNVCPPPHCGACG